MARISGIILLVAGGVLLFFGVQATHSVSERLVEGVSGKYTQGTMQSLVAGAICAAAGLGLLLFGGRRR